MKRLFSIHNIAKGALTCIFFLCAVPVNAGKLATASLPTYIDSQQTDWSESVVMTNIGRHAEEYTLTCYEAISGLTDTHTSMLDPGATEVYSTSFHQGNHLVRCELEFSGSVHDWRLMLCNYDNKFRGSPGDQCIEGH